MGSLASRPSVPTASAPQVVYIQQPASGAGASGVSGGATETNAEQSASAQRSENLLQRERSRFGTIQTSFRGLLGLADNTDKRKSLLGE